MKDLSDVVKRILHKGGNQLYKDSVATFEGLLVKRALELTGNNQVLAAKLLGISRNTLRAKDVKDPGGSLLNK